MYTIYSNNSININYIFNNIEECIIVINYLLNINIKFMIAYYDNMLIDYDMNNTIYGRFIILHSKDLK